MLAAHQRLTAASVPTGNGLGSTTTTSGQAQQQAQSQTQGHAQAQVQSLAQVQPAMMTERQRELEVETEGIGREAGGRSWIASSHREPGPAPALAIPTAALVLLGMCLGLSRRRETVPAWLARERTP